MAGTLPVVEPYLAALVGALLTPFPPMRHGSSLALQAARSGGLDVGSAHAHARARPRTRALPRRGPATAARRQCCACRHPRRLRGLRTHGTAAHHARPGTRLPGSPGRRRQLASAMAARLEGARWTLRTSCRVVEVIVEDGRATGCAPPTVSRSGVVAASSRTSPPPPSTAASSTGDTCPSRLRRRMATFEWDPGTVKVDWALDGPIPWSGAPDQAPGTVHLAPSVDALAVAGAETAAGVVPRQGLVLIGQMATTDPTRAPSGAESAWAYTHVPTPCVRSAREATATEASSRGRGAMTRPNGWRTGCRHAWSSAHRGSPIGPGPPGPRAGRAREP